jgi:hypothetical protein
MLVMYRLVQIKASVAIVIFMLVEIQGKVAVVIVLETNVEIKAKEGISHCAVVVEGES